MSCFLLRRACALLTTTGVLVLGTTAAVATTGGATILDVPYASRWDAAKSIAYGGVAGVLNSSQAARGPADFIDSCTHPMHGVDLYACNSRGIHPDLTFSVTFTAEKDGYPALIYTSSNGTNQVDATTTPTLITKGNTASFVTTWRRICSAIASANSNSGVDSNCNVIGGSASPKLTFSVGVYSTTPTTLDASASLTVQIADLAANEGSSSVVDVCSSNPPAGVCQFEVLPGDRKIEIRSPTVVSSGTALEKYKLRVLWVNGAGAFNQIKSSSAYTDLEFVANAAGTGNDLNNTRIDGFENDKTYSFKVALVDQAGNVGYYTKTGSADTDCAFTLNKNCHEATPGEVVGLLAENLNCFIATAAYGSSLAPQVDVFRQFRNAFLLPSEWGRHFVRFYYEHSPKYAKIIHETPVLRAAVRIALWPLLAYAWIAIKFGSVTAFVVLLIGSFSFALAAWSFGKWLRSGRARV